MTPAWRAAAVKRAVEPGAELCGEGEGGAGGGGVYGAGGLVHATGVPFESEGWSGDGQIGSRPTGQSVMVPTHIETLATFESPCASVALIVKLSQLPPEPSAGV
jgi:hypothetical protein